MRKLIMIRASFAVACGMLVGTVMLNTPVTAAQTSDELLAEVKATWERRQASIDSLKVNWKIKSFVPKGSISAIAPPGRGAKGEAPPQDHTYDGTGELLLAGKKARVLVQEEIWDGSDGKFQQGKIESTFDGDKFTRLLLLGSLWPMATIGKTNHNIDGDNPSVWPIILASRGLDRDLLRGLCFSEYSEARREVIEGRQIIELIRARNETNGETRIHIDPARGMSVSRVDTYDKKGILILRVLITQAAVSSPGAGWLPIHWTTQAYQQNKQLLKKTDVDVTSTTYNLSTNEADFKIVFPPDTRVTDTSEKEKKPIILHEATERSETFFLAKCTPHMKNW